MSYGELTINNINAWGDAAEEADLIINKWRAAVFKSDRPGKKDDLKSLQALQLEVDAAQRAIQSLAWEVKRRDEMRARDRETHKKLQRYCKALGGDPSLIYWHKDSDFV
jgi:hypothetical protein